MPIFKPVLLRGLTLIRYTASDSVVTRALLGDSARCVLLNNNVSVSIDTGTEILRYLNIKAGYFQTAQQIIRRFSLMYLNGN